MLKDIFLKAIYSKSILLVTFNSQEKGVITRKCVPFDFGPSKKFKDKSDRYHFYDLDSPDGKHNLSILDSQLISLEPMQDSFEPKDYIKWTPDWYIKRDWGDYS